MYKTEHVEALQRTWRLAGELHRQSAPHLAAATGAATNRVLPPASWATHSALGDDEVLARRAKARVVWSEAQRAYAQTALEAKYPHLQRRSAAAPAAAAGERAAVVASQSQSGTMSLVDVRRFLHRSHVPSDTPT